MIRFNSNKKVVFHKKGTAFPSLSTRIVNNLHPDEANDGYDIVAIGGIDRVFVLALSMPDVLELLNIPTPSYVEHGTIPYLHWGYGLTPCYRDRTYPLLAIAWGKVIQLYVLNDIEDTSNPLIPDGYYVSESPIDNIYFLSESILFALINKKEAKVLYTP